MEEVTLEQEIMNEGITIDVQDLKRSGEEKAAKDKLKTIQSLLYDLTGQTFEPVDGKVVINGVEFGLCYFNYGGVALHAQKLDPEYDSLPWWRKIFASKYLIYREVETRKSLVAVLG